MFLFRRKDVCKCGTPLSVYALALVKEGDDIFQVFNIICPLKGCVYISGISKKPFKRRITDRKEV